MKIKCNDMWKTEILTKPKKKMMVDMAQKSVPEEESNLKLKNFMGKTKSKLMKVLGSSNEIINDFSNKVI